MVAVMPMGMCNLEDNIIVQASLTHTTKFPYHRGAQDHIASSGMRSSVSREHHHRRQMHTGMIPEPYLRRASDMVHIALLIRPRTHSTHLSLTRCRRVHLTRSVQVSSQNAMTHTSSPPPISPFTITLHCALCTPPPQVIAFWATIIGCVQFICYFLWGEVCGSKAKGSGTQHCFPW